MTAMTWSSSSPAIQDKATEPLLAQKDKPEASRSKLPLILKILLLILVILAIVELAGLLSHKYGRSFTRFIKHPYGTRLGLGKPRFRMGSKDGVKSVVRRFDWTIVRNVQVVAGRSLIVNTVNGNVLSPTIHVANGDTLEVNVTNGLPDDMTSIHWHGFTMKDNQVYDGVVGVTQCGIVPGESYVYRFVVDEMPGTYLWHTHTGLEILGHTFIRGPLIVHPKGTDLDRYNYDNERILFYQELFPSWIAQDHVYALGGLSGSGDYINADAEGFPESATEWVGGLINAKEHDVLRVTAGKTYRFRIINGGLAYPYTFSIDDHELTVVSTDGGEVQPYKVDGIYMHLSERYEVEIAFKPSRENSRHLIRSETLSGQAGIYGTLEIQGSHKRKFDGGKYPESKRHTNPVILNCVELDGDSATCKPLTVLTPVTTLPLPDPANPVIHIVDWDAESAPLYSRFGSIDGGIFKQNVLPRKPIIKADFDPDTDFHPNANELKLELNKTVVIVFRSGTAFPHPLHMHGHKFEVLEVVPRKNPTCPAGRCEWHDVNQAFSVPIEELARRPKKGVLKDTVFLPTGGALAIRMITDNPGVWLVHCHIDIHLEAGQSFTIDEGEFKTSDYPPDYPSCDYTGKVQLGLHDSCDCLKYRNTYRPELEERNTYRCSKKYMCLDRNSGNASDNGTGSENISDSDSISDSEYNGVEAELTSHNKRKKE